MSAVVFFLATYTQNKRNQQANCPFQLRLFYNSMMNFLFQAKVLHRESKQTLAEVQKTLAFNFQ